MRACTQEWVQEQGMEMFLAEESRSPTVSAIRYAGRDPEDLVSRAREAGFVLAKGYGKLREETFRIGHMGDHPVARLRELLAALSD
jgi:aspartate aminotransferase-like enzyme